MTMLKRHCRRHCFAFLVLLSWSESVRCFAVPAGHNQQNLPFRSLARNRAVPPPRGYLDQLKQVSAASIEAEGGDPDDSSLIDPEASLPLTPGNTAGNLETPGFWPTFDALDTRLIRISLPVIANFAISPLVGAVDLFWVNRMGNVLAIAGQSAANQVFNSVFWLTSFLPSVSATIIAQENAKGNKEGVQDAVCNALFVGLLFAALSSSLLLTYPGKILSSVLEEGAPALAYAKPYLFIRAFASLPSIISLVGFSAFRGVQDTVTPVKISSFANVFNAILDPILIFSFAMGVPGAALATLAAEVVSAATYLYIMRKREMIRFSKIFTLPKWSKLSPLLRGGLALQLRNVALNVAFLLVARTTQTIDPTGVAAAAHALSIQTFQIGGIVLLALSSVSQTIVPNDLEIGGKRKAKSTVNRLMSWGFILGTLLGGLQLALLPVITMSTPIPEVREAARMPAILASIYQVINGMVFIGEGVMIGTGSFLQLSLGTVVATAGIFWALNVFPAKYGLTGVWIGFGVFNTIRLLGVIIHQLMNGPLAARNMKKEKETP
jgi:MATE family multidrug resistance protein